MELVLAAILALICFIAHPAQAGYLSQGGGAGDILVKSPFSSSISVADPNCNKDHTKDVTSLQMLLQQFLPQRLLRQSSGREVVIRTFTIPMSSRKALVRFMTIRPGRTGLIPSLRIRCSTWVRCINIEICRHAPDRLHEEISADYNDMTYAGSKPEIETKRKAFIRKWRPKCRAVADSLEEAGDKLFTFTRFPKSQWKSIRTSNAIERLHEEFKRRIKTQTVLPSAETAAMLFWALLASGQITMRKVDGWRSLNERPSDQTIDLAA